MTALREWLPAALIFAVVGAFAWHSFHEDRVEVIAVVGHRASGFAEKSGGVQVAVLIPDVVTFAWRMTPAEVAESIQPIRGSETFELYAVSVPRQALKRADTYLHQTVVSDSIRATEWFWTADWPLGYEVVRDGERLDAGKDYGDRFSKGE